MKVNAKQKYSMLSPSFRGWGGGGAGGGRGEGGVVDPLIALLLACML